MNSRVAMLGVIAFVLAAAVALIAVRGGLLPSTPSPSTPSSAMAAPPGPPVPRHEITVAGASEPTHPYVGVAAVRVSDLGSYQQMTSTKPGIIESYQSFGTQYPTAKTKQIVAYGALPFMQVSPRNMSLEAIALGKYDSYLQRYAAAIKEVGNAVALSFAPEANGNWYRWGCHRASASGFIAAWRHVHDVLTQSGARNVIWVWVVNTIYNGVCPIAHRWPGSRYVNWVGIDGQMRYRTTFKRAFEPTVRQVLKITDKPILMSEIAVPNGPLAKSEITSLFQGAERNPHIIGIIYFNYFDERGNYRLQDDPAELAAFRQETKNYLSLRPSR